MQYTLTWVYRDARPLRVQNTSFLSRAGRFLFLWQGRSFEMTKCCNSIHHLCSSLFRSVFVIPLIAIHFFCIGSTMFTHKTTNRNTRTPEGWHNSLRACLRSWLEDCSSFIRRSICGFRAALIKLASKLFPPFIAMIGTAAHISLDYKTRLPEYDVEDKRKSLGVKYWFTWNRIRMSALKPLVMFESKS